MVTNQEKIASMDLQTKKLGNFEERSEITFPCIKVRQRIGDFFIASINHKDLCKITYSDVRRMMDDNRDFEKYLGIQRPVDKKRVESIEQYVKGEDACFPTAIILSIPGECASYNENNSTMTLSNKPAEDEDDEVIYFNQIAKVLDGQHRIEGLRSYEGEDFDLNVSIFVDIDIATQAQIFCTVNLEQTKVSKSLVYDLFELATHRSPQKTCHDIAVTLDSHKDSPFKGRIKRLGTSSNGGFKTLSQATFIEPLLKLVSVNAKLDRNTYLENKKPQRLNDDQLKKVIFGNMFIDEKDYAITDVLWNYFTAVSERWEKAWNFQGTMLMLNRNNGYRALMRFLPQAYLKLTSPGNVPTKEEFLTILNAINIDDDEFNSDNFKPGAGGESALYRSLINKKVSP